MGSVQEWTKWVFDKMAGAGLWRIVDSTWPWVGAVMAAVAMGLWQAVVSPDGPWIFLISLGTFAVVLFIEMRIIIPMWEEKKKNGEQAERRRRKQIEILQMCIRAGKGVASHYRPQHPLRIPSFQDPEVIHTRWEGSVKTNLHNFLSESHVTRFIDSNEATVYADVTEGIPEKYRRRYYTLHAQMGQLQIFKDEIEAGGKTSQ